MIVFGIFSAKFEFLLNFVLATIISQIVTLWTPFKIYSHMAMYVEQTLLSCGETLGKNRLCNNANNFSELSELH